MFKKIITTLFVLSLNQFAFAEVLLKETCLSGDKQTLAVVYEIELQHDVDVSVALYSLVDGKLLRTIKGFERGIMDLSLNADGSRLAVGDFEDNTTLWDVTSGKQLARRNYDVDRIFFNDTGVVAMNDDGGIVQYDANLKPKETISQADMRQRFEQNNGNFPLVAVSLPLVDLPPTANSNYFYRKGNHFLAVKDKTVHVLDIAQQKLIGKFNTQDEDLVLSPIDGEVWVYSNYDGQVIEIWDYLSQTLKDKIDASGMGKAVRDIRFSSDTIALLVEIDDNNDSIIFLDFDYQFKNEIKLGESVYRMNFLDDKRIYVEAKQPKVWDVAAGKVLFKIAKP